MASNAPLRVLIADDEMLARQRLEDLLKGRNDIELLGMTSTGPETVEAIRSMHPELVFLDVQMPGGTGLDVVRQVGPSEMPVVIFVTAYDRYALKAFEYAAIDYLLKPFDDERFEKAVERARQIIEFRSIGAMADRLSTLLEQHEGRTRSAAEEKPPSEYLERIAVEMRGQIRIVPVERIECVTASGPYAELHVGDQTFVIRERLKHLSSRMDPGVFFRIHRSAIVKLDEIETLLHNAGGDYAVRLKSGRLLKVSRSRKEELEERLGLHI